MLFQHIKSLCHVRQSEFTDAKPTEKRRNRLCHVHTHKESVGRDAVTIKDSGGRGTGVADVQRNAYLDNPRGLGRPRCPLKWAVKRLGRQPSKSLPVDFALICKAAEIGFQRSPFSQGSPYIMAPLMISIFPQRAAQLSLFLRMEL